MSKLYYLFITIFTLWFGSIAQDWYPKVDNLNDWTISSFSGGAIAQAEKIVKTSQTTDETWRIFYSLSFRGVSYLGQYYTVSPVSEYTSVYSDSKRYYGYYNVVGLNRQIGMSYQLYKDGSFKIEAWWKNYWDQTNDRTTQAIFRVDYDLGNVNLSPSSNDIVEYVITQNDVRQWFGPSQDCSFSMPPQNENDENTIEYNAGVRIANSGDPANQLFAVFYAYGQGRSANFNFMNYSNDNWTLPPTSSNSNPLQNTATSTNYQQYAYSGNDQVLYLTLTEPDPNICSYCTGMGIKGMIYKKPNGRPIRVYSNTMQGAQSPDWNLVVDNQRTATDAFNQLTNNHFVVVNKNNLSNPYGNTITLAQVHAFMHNSRSV